MVMDSEKLSPQPLSGAEIQEGITYKVAEALAKTCHLHPDNAYTSVKAEISIRLVLSDFGRDVKDNHVVTATMETGIPGTPEYVEDHKLTVEPVPPNQFRVETSQDVPIVTVQDGKQVTRKVRYASRKVTS